MAGGKIIPIIAAGDQAVRDDMAALVHKAAASLAHKPSQEVDRPRSGVGRSVPGFGQGVPGATMGSEAQMRAAAIAQHELLSELQRADRMMATPIPNALAVGIAEILDELQQQRLAIEHLAAKVALLTPPKPKGEPK